MDRISGMLGDKLPEDIQQMFPDGIPDVTKLQGAVDGLSEDEIKTRFTGALADTDQAALGEFGTMMSTFASKSGVEVPAGVADGNAGDIAGMLSSAMKGEGGLGGALQMIQDASGHGGALDSVLDKVTGGKFDLLSILKRSENRCSHCTDCRFLAEGQVAPGSTVTSRRRTESHRRDSVLLVHIGQVYWSSVMMTPSF